MRTASHALKDCGPPADGPPGPANEVCSSFECGDGLCGIGSESCATCPSDCAHAQSFAVTRSASLGEGCANCPQDCGNPCADGCGDGVCLAGEDRLSCADDCGNGFINIAGVKTCEPTDGDEPFCGDGTCNWIETCEICEDDCGACPLPVCGDGECVPGEDCGSCPDDCPCDGDPCFTWECSGDGVCEQGAPAITCDDQNPCTSDTCDSDTGACTFTPVDGCTSSVVCTLSGEAGDWVSCPLNYARATTIKLPAVAADILFTFDASMVSAKELSACVPFADIPPAQCTAGAAGDAYCAGAFGPDFVCDGTLGRCSECGAGAPKRA